MQFYVLVRNILEPDTNSIYKFGFTTVGAGTISSKTSRPRHPRFLQAYPKLAVEPRYQKKFRKHILRKFFLVKIFLAIFLQKNSVKTRSVA
jgi:hypothetical protein